MVIINMSLTVSISSFLINLNIFNVMQILLGQIIIIAHTKSNHENWDLLILLNYIYLKIDYVYINITF